MTTVKFAPLKFKRIRLTALSSCGVPLTGACAMSVTSGVTSLERSGELENRVEFPVINGNGDFASFDTDAPKFKFINGSLIVTGVNPNELSWMTGEAVVTDDAATPNVVGWRTSEGAAKLANFALEGWTGLTGTSACAAGGERFGYFVMPWCREGVFHALKNGNEVSELKIDFITKSGSPWGTGPYPIRLSAATATLGHPMHLKTSIGSGDHQHHEVTTLAPPLETADCELVVKSLGTITKVSLTGTVTIPSVTGLLPGVIDWGDAGTPSVVAAGTTTVPHTYATNGTYTVTLRSSAQSGSVYTSSVTFP